MHKSDGAKGINSSAYRDQVLIPVITPLLDPESEVRYVLDLDQESLILMEDGAKVHERKARLYRLQQLWE